MQSSHQCKTIELSDIEWQSHAGHVFFFFYLIYDLFHTQYANYWKSIREPSKLYVQIMYEQKEQLSSVFKVNVTIIYI